jgi:hypothetical protein
MSKIIKIITEASCNRCLKIMLAHPHIYQEIEDLVELNKENINFVFTDYRLFHQYGNKYADLLNQNYHLFQYICSDCTWKICMNYNDPKIGPIIYCCN